MINMYVCVHEYEMSVIYHGIGMEAIYNETIYMEAIYNAEHDKYVRLRT